MKTHRKNGDFVQRPQPSERFIPRDHERPLPSHQPRPLQPMVAMRTISLQNVMTEPGVRYPIAPIILLDS
jgi:hypothetical protein